jgi:hypothetical protein
MSNPVNHGLPRRRIVTNQSYRKYVQQIIAENFRNLEKQMPIHIGSLQDTKQKRPK